MKRIYSERSMSAAEMHGLARQLERCGFHSASVGINYIDFYDHVELRRITNAVCQRNGAVHPGDDR